MGKKWQRRKKACPLLLRHHAHNSNNKKVGNNNLFNSNYTNRVHDYQKKTKQFNGPNLESDHNEEKVDARSTPTTNRNDSTSLKPI